MGKLFFVILSLITALTAFILSGTVFSKKKKADVYLGVTLLLSGVVILSYIISAFHSNYFVMSIFACIYFATISVMLLFLLQYIIGYTKITPNWRQKTILNIFRIWVTADIIIQIINPFKEIAIGYRFRPGNMAMWEFEPKLLYQLHLILCYLLILLIFGYLFYRSRKTPASYRLKYTSVMFGILFVVFLNAIFLIFQKEDMLDYSVLVYGIIGFFLYWNRYYYSQNGMLGRIRQMILDELDQPVFLFDSDDELAMCNVLAKDFVSDDEKESLTLSKFS